MNKKDKTTIPLKKSTRALLRSYKAFERESYDDLILRLVATYNEHQEIIENEHS